jgi:hypothetical protein
MAPAAIWRAAGWPGCVAMVCAMQAVMLVVVMRSWRLPAR